MAAEKQSNGKQRDRKPNFSSAENNLISSRATDELETLRGRFSKELSNSQKLEFWKTLTTEVNALGVACRTEAEIRNRWRNMTRSAKEKFTTERIERRKTGGGPPPATLTAAEGRIIDVMQDTASYAGIPGGQETSIALNGIDKGTVSRTVQAVANALCDKKDLFIKWPSVNQSMQTKVKFYQFGGFPNVIGLLDGTHIRIQAPHEDEASYVNRKGYHSVNVQAVCDADGKIINLNASWPGCCHDAHIFRTSQVSAYMERLGNWERGVLLGDSGYPCRPFLMTPFLNPQEENKKKFNRCHSVTRSIIERTFGRWKRRFHVLHSEIRMRPERACKVITACAVLHNISIDMLEPILEDINELGGNDDGEVNVQYNGPQDGRSIRQHITNTFFQ